ncbi:GFA family protein [Roseiarcus sp.]|uniref:GFA family protein n=1 Tax=Roseiarcus sp. TaxID=1969460 RepID=UPI003F96B592
MAQMMSGGCACRAIRYECEADPVFMLNCHCRDCQKANGSAFAAILAVPVAAVRLSGETRYYRVVGDSGHPVDRGFCQACGSQVTIKIGRRPDVLGLQAGCLDDPSVYRPTKDLFTSSAQSWDPMDRTLKKDPKDP